MVSSTPRGRPWRKRVHNGRLGTSRPRFQRQLPSLKPEFLRDVYAMYELSQRVQQERGRSARAAEGNTFLLRVRQMISPRSPRGNNKRQNSQWRQSPQDRSAFDSSSFVLLPRMIHEIGLRDGRLAPPPPPSAGCSKGESRTKDGDAERGGEFDQRRRVFLWMNERVQGLKERMGVASNQLYPWCWFLPLEQE